MRAETETPDIYRKINCSSIFLIQTLSPRLWRTVYRVKHLLRMYLGFALAHGDQGGEVCWPRQHGGVQLPSVSTKDKSRTGREVFREDRIPECTEYIEVTTYALEGYFHTCKNHPHRAGACGSNHPSQDVPVPSHSAANIPVTHLLEAPRTVVRNCSPIK